jgi:hypothetical protein
MYSGIHTSKCRKVKTMKKNLLVIVISVMLALVLAPAALALEVQDGRGTQIEARSTGLRVEWQSTQTHQRADNSDPDSILPPGLDPDHVHLWRCSRRYTASCPPASEDPIHAHPAINTP